MGGFLKQVKPPRTLILLTYHGSLGWRNSEEARTDRPSQQLRSLNGEWQIVSVNILLKFALNFC